MAVAFEQCHYLLQIVGCNSKLAIYQLNSNFWGSIWFSIFFSWKYIFRGIFSILMSCFHVWMSDYWPFDRTQWLARILLWFCFDCRKLCLRNVVECFLNDIFLLQFLDLKLTKPNLANSCLSIAKILQINLFLYNYFYLFKLNLPHTFTIFDQSKILQNCQSFD